MMRAIGFILRSTSGEHVRTHEAEMEREAIRLGFTWAATFFADAHREGNYVQMVNRIIREDADAVFLPGVGHLSGEDIAVLVTHCDVYCLTEGEWHTIRTEDDPGPEGSLLVVNYKAQNVSG
ncbi:hypothetical protein ACIRRA_22305 [Nocardia sp. NPDC101769]|uniref:hypothetical protein n=1 Tax=Nocardia sp. NPDC101769 TaxID=3364333 RepID=UPI003805006B